jgi:hypothetical protein
LTRTATMADQDSTPTKDYVNSLFEYKDGALYWKVDMPFHKVKGKLAGCIEKRGYWVVAFNKKTYKLHRIIFLIHHGYLPKFIDHIDGNPLNNRIENLREATLSQNAWNRKINTKTSSPIKGVIWHKKSGKWMAKININGKRTHLGTFNYLEDAEKVVKKYREMLHGEFAKHDIKVGVEL